MVPISILLGTGATSHSIVISSLEYLEASIKAAVMYLVHCKVLYCKIKNVLFFVCFYVLFV